MQNSKSKRGLNYSILAIVIFVVAIIFQVITSGMNAEFLSLLIGVFILISFGLAIIGAVYTIAGLKEGASMEQIIGLTISSVFLFIISYFLIEIYKRY